ncbi:Niemann-Pick type C2 protein Npc2-t01 [Operophtera brumata]|uniref:Niemann-Pick type C2 protein Npc2-t01 n=1 Tax=Operophtera brumata TaxID=104452 RepID=A0A0L7L650_OPEBR|nr:Niemann-Pick type C2 protein Npc2-t01 [Operophtera brumata]
MFRFVVFCSLLSVVFADIVSQCRNNAGSLPISTEVVGCSSSPCRLPQLEDAVINIKFKAPRDSTSLRTLATAYLGFIPIPYDLGANSNACNGLGNAQCPVNVDQELDYALRMYIEPFFPVGTTTTVEFRVVDDTNAAAFCVRMPIVIAAPRN